MVVLIVVTVCLILLSSHQGSHRFQIFFNIVLNNSYGPLLHSLPLTLAEKMYVAPEVPDTHSAGSHDPETPVVKKLTPIPLSEDRGFLHPALRFPQRTIWIPQDTLGLGEGELRNVRDDGIDVVYGEGAFLDEKGKLVVDEDPGRPGELGAYP